jgi:hypothetical protein
MIIIGSAGSTTALEFQNANYGGCAQNGQFGTNRSFEREGISKFPRRLNAGEGPVVGKWRVAGARMLCRLLGRSVTVGRPLIVRTSAGRMSGPDRSACKLWL